MAGYRFMVGIMLLMAAGSAHAADFYGATVTDQDVPTVAWKAGITGVRPIVGYVPVDSPAGKYGLKMGDIILSVNEKKVQRSSELSQFTTDTVSVYVFDNTERKTLTIDRLAIEREKPKPVVVERKAVVPQRRTYGEEPADNSPPVVLNDTVLEKKFRKVDPVVIVEEEVVVKKKAPAHPAPPTPPTSPAPAVPAAPAAPAAPPPAKKEAQAMEKKDPPVVFRMSKVYGGKTLQKWSDEYGAMSKGMSELAEKVKSNLREATRLRNENRTMMLNKEDVDQISANIDRANNRSKVYLADREKYNSVRERLDKIIAAAKKAHVPESFLNIYLHPFEPL